MMSTKELQSRMDTLLAKLQLGEECAADHATTHREFLDLLPEVLSATMVELSRHKNVLKWLEQYDGSVKQLVLARIGLNWGDGSEGYGDTALEAIEKAMLEQPLK